MIHILIPEVSNAVWKKVQNSEISQKQGTAIMANLPIVIDRIVVSSQLIERAFELALQCNHPVYDCLYLSLAEKESATLITDDRKLIGLAKAAKLSRRVRSLRDVD